MRVCVYINISIIHFQSAPKDWGITVSLAPPTVKEANEIQQRESKSKAKANGFFINNHQPFALFQLLRQH